MIDAITLFVFGASGHAKVVIDAIERSGREVLFVCDDAREKHGTRLLGHPVVKGREELLARRTETRVGIVGIGDNSARMRVAEWLLENECALAQVVHPSASIGREVEIEDGTV